MDKIRKVNSVSEYNEYWGLPDRHPYVNVLEGSQIGEIAYSLGYQYPQYFNRAFKKAVGCSPNEYRQANLQ